jgi:hypothetical protein
MLSSNVTDLLLGSSAADGVPQPRQAAFTRLLLSSSNAAPGDAAPCVLPARPGQCQAGTGHYLTESISVDPSHALHLAEALPNRPVA